MGPQAVSSDIQDNYNVVRCIFMMREFVNDSRMRQHMSLKFIPWVQLLESLKSDDLDIKSEVKF